MFPRPLIYLSIWLAVVIVALWLILYKASAQTQGSGSKALLKGIKQPSLPPMPKAVVLPPPAARYFFAATATDNRGLTSDFSSEVSTTNRPPVTLSWTPGKGSNVITNFTVLRGTKTGVYTKSWPAGTNCVLSVPPPEPTNCIVTIAGVGFFLVLTNPTGFRMFPGTNMTISKRYQ